LRLSSRSDPLTCSTLSPGFPPVHGIFRKPPPILPSSKNAGAEPGSSSRAEHATQKRTDMAKTAWSRIPEGERFEHPATDGRRTCHIPALRPRLGPVWARGGRRHKRSEGGIQSGTCLPLHRGWHGRRSIRRLFGPAGLDGTDRQPDQRDAAAETLSCGTIDSDGIHIP